jgi:hypothetical protein
VEIDIESSQIGKAGKLIKIEIKLREIQLSHQPPPGPGGTALHSFLLLKKRNALVSFGVAARGIGIEHWYNCSTPPTADRPLEISGQF